MKRGVAVVVVLLGGACASAPGPRDQWTVSLVTDATVPQFGDRILVEILDDAGSLACPDCRRQLPLATDTAWPVTFGIVPPGAGRVHVRARLFRSDHVDTDGLPRGTALVDVMGELPPARGVRSILLALPMDCFGVPSDPVARTTCDADTRATGPEPLLAEPDDRVGLRPGSWAPGLPEPCGRPIRDDMVCVPGGAFVLGDARLAALGAPAIPERLAVVRPFALDRDEVTVGAVRALVASGALGATDVGTRASDTACTWLGPTDGGNDAFPISCITHETAAKICAAQGKRLPTEAEWEWAAGSTTEERQFPWPSGDPCDEAIVGRGRSQLEGATRVDQSTSCRVPATGPVRPWGPVPGGSALDVTREGARDMGGNVAEWVADAFAPYDDPCWGAGVPLVEPSCQTGNVYSIRGGSWGGQPAIAAVGERNGAPLTSLSATTGVRCAE